MKTFEVLQQKIKADTGLELNNFRQTRIGEKGKNEGKWLWVATDADGVEYGSTYRARELVLKRIKLRVLQGACSNFNTNEIEPEQIWK